MTEMGNTEMSTDEIIEMLQANHAAMNREETPYRVAKEEIERLQIELEETADKLSTVWLHLDSWARGQELEFVKESAASILRHQQSPGWKT